MVISTVTAIENGLEVTLVKLGDAFDGLLNTFRFTVASGPGTLYAFGTWSLSNSELTNKPRISYFALN